MKQPDAATFLKATLPLVGFLSRKVTKFLGLHRNLAVVRGYEKIWFIRKMRTYHDRINISYNAKRS